MAERLPYKHGEIDVWWQLITEIYWPLLQTAPVVQNETYFRHWGVSKINKQPDCDAVQAKTGNSQLSTGGAEQERRPWFPPVLEDFELAMEVTAYAGRR